MSNSKLVGDVSLVASSHTGVPRVFFAVAMRAAQFAAMALAAVVVIIGLCLAPRRFRKFMRDSCDRSAVRQVICEAKLVDIGAR